MVLKILHDIPSIYWSFDVLRDVVNSLVLGLGVNCGDANSERSIVLEYHNFVLFVRSISIVLSTIVPSLVHVLTSLIIHFSIVVIVWLGSANLGVKFALSSKQNFLAKLASLEVIGLFFLNVMVDFGDQFWVSGVLTYGHHVLQHGRIP